MLGRWLCICAMSIDRIYPRDLTDRLLAGASLDARQDIIAKSRPRTLRAGQALFRTGEPAEQLFLLRKGRVLFSRLAHTGREIVMGILVPGDVFGLGTILTQPVNYIGTAKSLEPGEVLVWTRQTIQALTAEHPQLSENALYVALRYVAEFAERHERLATVTAEQRLARALTRLGVRTGIRKPSGVEVRIKNEQLASLADVSPFTASRLLKRWERDGLITKRRGIVYILCPERLLLD
jgi:CRP-like cAMP-binding protein